MRDRGVVRTPTLLQMEAVECGAAALGIVLAYHGRLVPLGQLRRDCGVSRDGSKASNVVKAARHHGMLAKGFSKDLEGLRALKAPYIVYWNFNHFLVVEGLGERHAWLNDPASGHRKIDLEEFEESFTGVVLVAEPGEDFTPGGEAPRTWPLVLARLQGFGPAVLFALLAGLIGAIPHLALPALSRVFLDRVLVEQRESWLGPLLLGMLVAVLALALGKRLQLSVLRRMRLSLCARSSARFFRHLLRLPLSFYAQRYGGEVASRSRLDDRVAATLCGRLAESVVDGAQMLLFFAAIWWTSWEMAAGAGVLALANLLLLRSLAQRQLEANLRVQQDFGKVTGASIAGLQSLDTLKASGIESAFFRRWSGQFAAALASRQSLDLGQQTLTLIPRLLEALGRAGVLVLGGFMVLDGSLTVGGLVAVQLLLISFLQPVSRLVEAGREVQDLRADLARMEDVLSEEVQDSVSTIEASCPMRDGQPWVRLEGALNIRGLCFGYSPLEPPLLEDFELQLEPGQRVALVGGSGSGKSTLARLVCGLEKPWSGQVRFDGLDRAAIDPRVMHNSVAYVDQDILLFAGSIRSNLSLWDPTVEDSALLQACEDAEILELMRSLPGGLDSELLEGGNNLSGGQRQRLEIARALAIRPSVLILDEATSALDAETERRILEHLRRRGCTCLIVAHRLSTIRDCDEIVVLDRGEVVERGPHAQLWQKQGHYHRLLAAVEEARS